MLGFFDGREGGGVVVATDLANLSPPEDSVGHDLGLVVLPWGGHCERSRIAARVQGFRSGGEVISEWLREGATPRQRVGI